MRYNCFKEGAPNISFKQELPLSCLQPPTLTLREERQRKQDERRAESPEPPDTQESTESEKKKEEKSPPHSKKHKNKKPKVVKGKEYKIWQPKKSHHQEMFLMFRKFQFPKRTQ